MRVAFALVLLAAGCTLDRPFDRIDLIPSAWDVVSVAGTAIAVGTAPTLVIDRNNAAQLNLRCGAVDLRYGSDTVG
jgi:hypothetical protein